jgi:8-oxo-dGTP diphosphatase
MTDTHDSQPDQEQTALRPTHVVTCFLLRADDNYPQRTQLLIVRRSQRVGSYQGHWGGISGFVESGVTPDEQAYTEIREETQLQREQVQMLRRGAVVEYIDAAIGRHWYVHPFLFRILAPDAVHTDWEAEEHRWIDPETLANYETVPKLWEAFQSALHGEEVK